MKNTKQLLVIASIAAGVYIGSKPVHAQQSVVNSITKQPTYNYDINSNQVVKLGDKGTIVKNIQSALNLYYGAGLAEDGIYGQHTKEAVIKIQKKFSLKADGILGPQTAKALLIYSSSCSIDTNDGFSPVPIDIQKKNNLPITGKTDTRVMNKINETIRNVSADETKFFKSNTNYYVLVNTSGHNVKVYQKINNSWEQVRCFDVFSGEIDKGLYSIGLQGDHLNFNGVPMKDFTQIDGLKVFYSSTYDSGYGLRVSNESAKFLATLPKKTSIKVF